MRINIVKICFRIANGQISWIFDKVICPPPSVFLFLYNNLSEYQCIFTKLGMCIDIMEIWFGIANGKFRHLDSYLSTKR